MRAMASLRFSSVSTKKKPSLLQILPKPARSTASLLSQEEKDVLTYLLHLHHHLFFIGHTPPSPSPSPSPSPPSKPHWTKKPWRHGVSSSSSSSQKVPPSPSFSFRVSEEASGSSKKSSTSSKSVSCTDGMGCCKRASSSFTADDDSNFNCDCFCCYSIFWRRWNDSPNRDVISQILEIVEMQDCNNISGIAEKNDQERKQSINVEEVGGKKQRKKKNEKKKGADVALELQPKEEDMAKKVGPNCLHTQAIPDISVSTELKENFTFATAQSFEAVTKSTALKKKDSKRKSMKTVAPLDETQPWVSEVNNDTEETELNVALPNQASIATSAGSSAFHQSPRHQVSGKKKKKKKNQVTPLDCESHLIDEEKEEKQDDSVTEESAIFTDTSLKETGFIERVVRGTLGGVASRLWNLVSLRFGSQSVDSDYYY